LPSPDRPLTEIGEQESREIGENIRVNPDQTVGYSGDIIRSVATTLLAMNPDLDERVNLEGKIKEYLERGRIRKDPALLYHNPSANPEFQKALDQATHEGHVFDFLVHESDEFAKESGVEISTHSNMVRAAGSIVSRYMSVLDNWDKVSSKYQDKELYRVFCAKEYIFPSFRAEMTRHVAGDEEMERYIQWYDENIEGNKDKRTETARVHLVVENGDYSFYLEDSFGKLPFSKEDIMNILKPIHERNVREEIDYYGEKFNAEWRPHDDPIIENAPVKQSVGFIFNEAGQILIVKKDNGKWTIPGGTTEPNEVPIETCRREIFEEAYVTIKDLEELGTIVVVDKDLNTHLQKRFAGRLDQTVDFPEKNTFETVERKFVAPDELIEFIPYADGKIFQAILQSALAYQRRPEKNES